jgi:hypothetical protein
MLRFHRYLFSTLAVGSMASRVALQRFAAQVGP